MNIRTINIKQELPSEMTCREHFHAGYFMGQVNLEVLDFNGDQYSNVYDINTSKYIANTRKSLYENQ